MLAALMLTGLLALPASYAAAAPGQLVATFGSGGTARVDVDGSGDNVDDQIVVDEQGRIVVLATSVSGSSALLRFAPSGAFDPSFGGGDGAVSIPGGPWHDLALQPDGRIVVAGSENHDFALARYNQDGSPDPTFGPAGGIVSFHAGKVSDPSSTSVAEALEDIVIESDGRMVVAGNAEGCFQGSENCFRDGSVVARFTPEGSLDQSFGSSGLIALYPGELDPSELPPLHHEGRIETLALGQDGQVLVGGTTGENLMVLRLRSDGTLDPGFSSDGVVLVRADNIEEREAFAGGDAKALVVEPSGRIVAFGERVLIGLTADGGLDPAFGSKGVGSLDSATFRRLSPEDAVLDSKGRILVAGGYGYRGAVARFLADGSYDARFGHGGLVLIKGWSGRPGRETPMKGATGIALLADGSVAVAGLAFADQHSQLGLANLDDSSGRLAYCHGVPAAVQGTPASNHLFGRGAIVALGGGDEIISFGGPVCSGSGDDEITDSSYGNVYGGSGNDRITGSGPGVFFGGPGNDEIRASGGEGADDFHGGPGADVLDGEKGPDRLFGGPGSDRLLGGGGRDRLSGGPGDDFVFGGAGTDQLSGGLGIDQLFPGPDNPPEALYRMSRPGFRIRLRVRNHRLAGLHLEARISCKGGREFDSGHDTNHFGLRIHADGTFRYSRGYNRESLAGRVRPGSIVGTYVRLEGYNCATGSPGHHLLHFSARRQVVP
jgi:uncharacterized delta-60 repeat protein